MNVVDISKLCDIIVMVGSNDFEIKSVSSSYVLNASFVDVFATIKLTDVVTLKVSVGQMANTDNWNDSDVMQFAKAQLEKFKVVE